MVNKQAAVQLSIGDLPEFEGVIPVGAVTKLKGTSQRIHRPIHLGEKGVLVVEYEAVDIGHRDTKDGVKRHQVLSVDELYELGGERASELIQELRKEYRLADDQRKGRQQLATEDTGPFDAGVPVTTDSAGVVMTPAEAAEAAGRHLEAAPDAEAVPFDGIELMGARQLVAHIKASGDREHVLAIAAWEEGRENRSSVVNAGMRRAAELA